MTTFRQMDIHGSKNMVRVLEKHNMTVTQWTSVLATKKEANTDATEVSSLLGSYEVTFLVLRA